jgi:hypothetical protein
MGSVDPSSQLNNTKLFIAECLYIHPQLIDNEKNTDHRK